MKRNFGTPKRHPGLSRAFDLTSWAYFMDFALVPPAALSLCLWAMHRDIGLLMLVVSIAGGALTWSLAEYWIHRLVFHGATPFEPMHEMHHQLPKDMIGLASWETFIGFAGIWLVAEVFTGAAIGSAFAAGFMAGYLAYCVIHIRMDHGDRASFSRYTAFMFQHHAGHHRGGQRQPWCDLANLGHGVRELPVMTPARGRMVPLLAALVLLIIGVRARAGDEPRIPCWVVKAAVAAHGEEAALRHARARGYSERQINEARRCLR
jgi:dihydroceramide fatty acyl 2-hydroxylase